MEIRRDIYLNRLIDSKSSSLIKVITGIRRCGKSYLLFNLFYRHLISQGVMEDHIIRIALDDDENRGLLAEGALSKHVKSRILDSQKYYVLLDEIQNLPNFAGILNGLNRLENLDIYVTGSNSRLLSGQVATEFRGRGYEIKINPLSFSEYYEAFPEDREKAFRKFCLYGGMPQIALLSAEAVKADMLGQLLSNVYVNDIVERNRLRKEEGLDRLLDILASNVGALTSPTRLARTFQSAGYKEVTNKTVDKYVDLLSEAFLVSKALRYDIKGNKYATTPYKIYFSDPGLRNSRLNFRQVEENHLMENIVYNELLTRGYSVDVGMVSEREFLESGKNGQKQLEVDFVANMGGRRCYIQVAYGVPDMEKFRQETASFMKIRDGFPRILLVMNGLLSWTGDNGVKVINIMDFLLNPNSLIF